MKKTLKNIIPVLKQVGLSLGVCLLCLTLVSGVSTLFAPKEDVVEKENELAGKYISFMGDSITTYEGWNNNTYYNSTIGSNAVFYNSTKLASVNDTYWKKTVDELDLKLCVNNSYSGSTTTTLGSAPGCMTRTANLHNDNLGIVPDIIVLYMGTNDLRRGYELGSFNSVSDIYDSASGEYVGNLTTFAHAYATMVHKVKANYPDADIYVCTISHTDVDGSEWAKVITKIADVFNVNLVDFYGATNITDSTLSTYTLDSRHPNKAGMEEMYKCLKKAIERNYN